MTDTVADKASGKAEGRSGSNTQIAAASLKHLILTNRLPAGSNHLESELATRLGMSRTPIREAVLLLEAQGLLEVQPRRGIRVTPISSADMAEIYDILTVLEGLAVELAAAKQLSAESFLPMERAISDMDQALASNDRVLWSQADDTFHAELLNISGNERLQSIVSMFNDQVQRARAITLYLRPLPLKSNDDHWAVLEAIRSGDAKQAGDIHRAHRIAAKNMLLDLLDRHGFHQI